MRLYTYAEYRAECATGRAYHLRATSRYDADIEFEQFYGKVPGQTGDWRVTVSS